MHRAQDQMPRLGGLHGNFGGFPVPDLAHHHHVRILAEHSAELFGESDVRLLIDGQLGHVVKVVFHRVFDGRDVFGRPINLPQSGVQRGRFTAARRAARQEHAVGL